MMRAVKGKRIKDKKEKAKGIRDKGQRDKVLPSPTTEGSGRGAWGEGKKM